MPSSESKINSDHTPRARLTRFEDIEEEETLWLWPDRLPAGEIVVIAGDPGLGKSTVTLDWTAAVSTGRAWPDGEPCEQGGVLLVSCEDSLTKTVKKRLRQAGASMDRVRHLDGAADGKAFGLEDISTLRDAVAQVQEECGSCRLIIIDPASAFCGSKDANSNAEVRAMLAPLHELAEEAGACVVLVSHLNKGQGRAMYRGIGSIAWNATARVVYQVAADEHDRDVRLLSQVKNNLAPEAKTYSFEIDAGRVRWLAEEDVTADEALEPQAQKASRGGKKEAAKAWLIDLLAGSPMTVSEVKAAHAALGDDCGFSWKTVERARQGAGVASVWSGEVGGETTWRVASEGFPPPGHADRPALRLAGAA